MLSRYRVGSEVAQRLVSALSLAMPRCTDDRALGMIYGALATDAMGRGDLEDAIDFGQSSDTYLLRAGDVRNACNTRINDGYALTLVGQYGKAETLLREALAMAERAGIVTMAALANHNLGPVLAHRGNLAEGEAHEREALRAYETLGNVRLQAGSRFYLGRILLSLGRVDEAEAEMRRACVDAQGTPPLLPLAQAGLALAFVAAGKTSEALRSARQAVALMDARGGSVEEPQTVKLALVEALVATRETAEAERVVAALHAELALEASRLRDPELRRTFLEEVHDHARIAELHAILVGSTAAQP